ncbi:MAG: hypothetical protein WCV50_04445 [Patescibacteria group bacterium]|jgi:hypothetical protein
MSDQSEVSIYSRHIRLEVVIPEKYFGEFIMEFGQAFAVEGGREGIRRIKAVDSYYNHPSGWHIKASVHEDDEDRFYEFLRGFCQSRDLPFRDPKAKATP